MHNISLHNTHLAEIAAASAPFSLLELLGVSRPKIIFLLLFGHFIVLLSRLVSLVFCIRFSLSSVLTVLLRTTSVIPKARL